MQAQVTEIPVEEYLNTSYEGGDREYVDGKIVERNLGEKDHSRPQRKLILFFGARESTLGTYAFPEQRLQVQETLFRVPDVCVYIGAEPDEQVFQTPPFLVIEILSKDDRATDIQEKIEDYLSFGVSFVWVIDPRTKTGFVYSRQGALSAKDGVLRTKNPDIELPIADLF